jgi:hypothetical protein
MPEDSIRKPTTNVTYGVSNAFCTYREAPPAIGYFVIISA